MYTSIYFFLNKHKRCNKPLPCGHSCSAKCGDCTRRTLAETSDQAQTAQHAHEEHDHPAITVGLWVKGETAIDLGGKSIDTTGDGVAATVLKAAEERSHHETCTVVSCRVVYTSPPAVVDSSRREESVGHTLFNALHIAGCTARRRCASINKPPSHQGPTNDIKSFTRVRKEN